MIEPAPVITPQLTRQTTSSGASLRIGMTLTSGTVAISAYVPSWRYWKITWVPFLKRLVPSNSRYGGLHLHRCIPFTEFCFASGYLCNSSSEFVEQLHRCLAAIH